MVSSCLSHIQNPPLRSLPLPPPHHGLRDLQSQARSRMGVRPAGILGSPPSTGGFPCQSSKEQLRRCLSLRNREGCGDQSPGGSSQLREHHLCPLSPLGDTASDNPSSQGVGVSLLTGLRVLQIHSSSTDRLLLEEPQEQGGRRNLSLCHRTRRDRAHRAESRAPHSSFCACWAKCCSRLSPAGNEIPSQAHQGTQQQAQGPQALLSLTPAPASNTKPS